jgi:hypothetical protein
VFDEERAVIDRIRSRFREGPHPVKWRHYSMAMSNYYAREAKHRLREEREYLNIARLTVKALMYNPFNTRLYRQYAAIFYPN